MSGESSEHIGSIGEGSFALSNEQSGSVVAVAASKPKMATE
jgi:hypothetical protein